MHKGRISLEKKSHIVSFDDARRSARGGSVRSDAASGSYAQARGAARASSYTASGRSYAQTDRADGYVSASRSRGGAGERGRHTRSGERASARGSSARAARGSFFRSDLSSTRSVAADVDPDAGCEDASAAPLGKRTLGSRFSDKLSASKRVRAKEKADRRFARQYGANDADEAADSSAGPRAAVYKGEMGSQHKRAARMQGEGDSSRSSATFSSSKKSRNLHPALLTSLVVAACLVFGCVFLYDPAKTYYQEIRECDRLEAEYAALQQRNEAIQDEVDSLSTDAGIEDKARSEFGWVKEGENAVSVAGVDTEDDSDFMANIVAGSVEAPDTWYSFLDPIFGVE